jgi:phosphatidate cytidylyltransferase
MLGTRIISGLVLAAAAIVVVIHGGTVFFAVIVALALLGLNEFYRVLRPYRPIALAGFLSLALVLYMAWFQDLDGMFAALALALLVTFLFAGLGGPRRGVTGRIAVTVLGVLYLGLGFGFMLLTRRLVDGSSMLLTVIFGTWTGDTLAYFTGRYFGSTPMTPRLSPKKTWEGFAGGAISTILLVVFIGLYTPLGPSQSLLLGATIAIAGPVGDLFESLIKRDVAAKDTGRSIPGHGGVLDRFDALIFAAVASYYVLTVGFGI